MDMKRICSLLLIAALAACGNDAPPPAPPIVAVTPAPATEVGATPAPADTPPPDAPATVSTLNEPLPPFEEDGSDAPQITGHGTLKGIGDKAPDIGGDLTLYLAADGAYLLRIDNLRTPAGTPLDLAFSSVANAASDDDLKKGTLALGPLKAANGNMNYIINPDPRMAKQQSLLLVTHDGSKIVASSPLKTTR
jgi:hypothetical protein